MPDDSPNDATLAAAESSSAPALVVGRFAQRYLVGELLGRGGMGEVRAVHDNVIGRDVAIKRAHDREHAETGSGCGARLVDEARTQGRLEHPAIVPVYDLGEDQEGAPYFTMRRLHGSTLAQVLAGLADRDASQANRWGRARLLGVLVDVAQAVAYAHRRGVVHRDLKPANVMLGDFGELYVLDWGIARDVSTGVPLSTPTPAASGTPGYMAPEQIEGGDVDARADLYALGAMLFEVLANAPLVPRGAPLAVTAATLRGVDPTARMQELGIDLPPELVVACVRATARDPADRYESVDSLIDELQRFLEGDRDLTRRRALSIEHDANARRILDDAREPADFAVAMHELGHALALDHHNKSAMATLSAALTTMPVRLPPELQRRREVADERFSRRLARFAVAGYAMWVVLTLFIAVHRGETTLDVQLLLGGLVLQLVLCTAYVRGRFGHRSGVLLCCAVNAVLIAITTRIFGPVVIGPMLAVATSTIFVLHALPAVALPVVALGIASFVTPWLLEHAGVLGPSFVAQHGTTMPLVIELQLLIVGVACVVIITVTVASLRQRVASQQGRAELQAWYLGELAPGSAEAVGTMAEQLRSTGDTRVVR